MFETYLNGVTSLTPGCRNPCTPMRSQKQESSKPSPLLVTASAADSPTRLAMCAPRRCPSHLRYHQAANNPSNAFPSARQHQRSNTHTPADAQYSFLHTLLAGVRACSLPAYVARQSRVCKLYVSPCLLCRLLAALTAVFMSKVCRTTQSLVPMRVSKSAAQLLL